MVSPICENIYQVFNSHNQNGCEIVLYNVSQQVPGILRVLLLKESLGKKEISELRHLGSKLPGTATFP